VAANGRSQRWTVQGESTRRIRHVCWDGCVFPNAVMMQPATWQSILRAMIAVRDAHGWQE